MLRPKMQAEIDAALEAPVRGWHLYSDNSGRSRFRGVLAVYAHGGEYTVISDGGWDTVIESEIQIAFGRFVVEYLRAFPAFRLALRVLAAEVALCSKVDELCEEAVEESDDAALCYVSIDIPVNEIEYEGGQQQAMHDGRQGQYDMIFSSYAWDDFPRLSRYVLLDTLDEHLRANSGVVLPFDANDSESTIDAFDYNSLAHIIKEHFFVTV